jgi:hypothetical protein
MTILPVKEREKQNSFAEKKAEGSSLLHHTQLLTH